MARGRRKAERIRSMPGLLVAQSRGGRQRASRIERDFGTTSATAA
jgi:hypothetical protein